MAPLAPTPEAVDHATLQALTPDALEAVDKVHIGERRAPGIERESHPWQSARAPSSQSPRSAPLHPTQQAFGPGGLGILIVTAVPGLPAARAALLPAAHALATRLSPAARARLEDPASSFQMGWSHGREALAGGRPDTAKGSFYGNPLMDAPGEGEAEGVVAAFPGLARPCVWPSPGHGDPAEDELAGSLPDAFRSAGALMAGVGAAVAAAADALLAGRGAAARPSLVEALGRGKGAKGRLLWYYPPPRPAAPPPSASPPPPPPPDDGWCGWHVDHSLLTVLCPAVHLDEATGAEVACPDADAGLWARPRGGGGSATTTASTPPVRVTIPPGALAVQVGEAAQVLAGGALEATPHCVRAPRAVPGTGAADADAADADAADADATARQPVGRASFALFLQPWVDVPLTPPPGRADPATVGVPRWRPGDTFGQFSERTVAAYWGVS